jgi:dipeptidyl aminopeptidase/acylaminoacyl peptidase
LREKELTVEVERVSFSGNRDKIIGMLHLPDGEKPPCVIASHGLSSSKDGEKYVVLGERLSQRGIALLRFDFRGCGESDGEISDSTVSERLNDLCSAIGLVRSEPRIGSRIGLMGSSLGGFISLIVTARDGDIKAVAAWAAPYSLIGLEQRRDDPEMTSLGEEFFEDLRIHDLTPLLRTVSRGLVIHGNQDELVPVGHARMIYERLSSPKGLEIIDGGDHRLTHPDHREKAIETTLEWFVRYL